MKQTASLACAFLVLFQLYCTTLAAPVDSDGATSVSENFKESSSEVNPSISDSVDADNANAEVVVDPENSPFADDFSVSETKELTSAEVFHDDSQDLLSSDDSGDLSSDDDSGESTILVILPGKRRSKPFPQWTFGPNVENPEFRNLRFGSGFVSNFGNGKSDWELVPEVSSPESDDNDFYYIEEIFEDSTSETDPTAIESEKEVTESGEPKIDDDSSNEKAEIILH